MFKMLWILNWVVDLFGKYNNTLVSDHVKHWENAKGKIILEKEQDESNLSVEKGTANMLLTFYE